MATNGNIPNGNAAEDNKRRLFNTFNDEEVFKFGEWSLKSGQKTPIYIDLRRLYSRPTELHQAAEAVCQIIKDKNLKYDHVLGVPYAAVPLATHVSLILNVSMLMLRKEAKDYGTKQMIEGIHKKGDKILLIEDVVTHGDSIRETVEILKGEGFQITDSISVVDRQQGGGDMLRKAEINYYSVLTMESILTGLIEKGIISNGRKEEIIDHLKKPY